MVQWILARGAAYLTVKKVKYDGMFCVEKILKCLLLKFEIFAPAAGCFTSLFFETKFHIYCSTKNHYFAIFGEEM